MTLRLAPDNNKLGTTASRQPATLATPGAAKASPPIGECQAYEDGPQCGPAYSPGVQRECYFCGRMLHAECEAYWGDAEPLPPSLENRLRELTKDTVITPDDEIEGDVGL